MAEKQRWSREHDACRGWGPEDDHHPCASPHLPHNAGGRCIRCYALERKRIGQDRDIFLSVNDEVLPGDPRPDQGKVQVPTMVNGQQRSAIEPDVAKRLARFGSEPTSAPPASVPPPPARATKAATDGAPHFEVFTIVGGMAKEIGPSLTIRRDGRLSINRVALDALDHPVFVELLFDRERRILGVRKSSSGVAHARMIGREKSAPVRGYVSVKPLLAHYGLTGALAQRGATTRYGDVLAVQLVPAEQQTKGR